ncbi:MAG TPA: hypothetical protein VM689_20725 [Aliidongia sp.]|nr:hypothetical protein [Aliidongia sp.]
MSFLAAEPVPERAPACAFSIYSGVVPISANTGYARSVGINRRVGSLITIVTHMEIKMFKYALPRLLVLAAMLGLAACANVATPAQMSAANYEYSYQEGN